MWLFIVVDIDFIRFFVFSKIIRFRNGSFLRSVFLFFFRDLGLWFGLGSS